MIRNLVLAIFLFLSIVFPAHAEEGSRVILVLDASGSMRAKIDGKSKIDIAKQVVGKIISTWKPEDEIGLIAYGHREKGNCKDIEVLREPGPLNAEDFMAAVKGISPKGQTPMTDAVRMAAEALQYTEKKATVILVSDGIENCDADPCAVAEELKKAGVGLVVHTVGFGLDNKGAVAQLKCLAEKTGGTFTLANNASELQKALSTSLAAKPAPAPTPSAVEKFNTRGHAKQTASLELAKPFDQPSWTFKKPDGVDGTEGAFVAQEYGVDLKTNLASGDYVVTVQSDRSFWKMPIKVEDGKVTKLDADLEAGIVKLSGMIDDKTPMTDKGASWELHAADDKYIDTEYGDTYSWMLNAGKYWVELRLGEARTKAEFEIKSGETTTKVISMGAGKLLVSAFYSEGGEALKESAAFEVYHQGASADEKGEWVNTNYGSHTKFDLPAGKYIVVVKLDIGETHQTIDLAAGATLDLKINANMGFVAASAEGATSYVVSVGKKSLDGSNQNLTTNYDPKLNLAVNAGNYLVQAFNHDTLIGEKLVDVKAGERSTITLP